MSTIRDHGEAMKESLIFSWRVLRASVARFAEKDAPTHSAAISYAMVFSLPPMLLIVLWAAGLVYQEVLVREAVFSEMGALVGEEGARQLLATLEGLDIQKPTWWATAVAAGTLLFTASTVLVSGQNALNRIFGVEAAASAGLGLSKMLFDRLFSFAMLVTFAFILSVSLVGSALIHMFGTFLSEWSEELSSWLTVFDSALLNYGAMTLVFVLLFRYLPDVQMKWRDTFFGGLLTAGLFALGKSLIGFLIGKSEVADLYDAAGSVLVLMLWVYYASAIFLFGATFTWTRADILARKTEAASDRPSKVTVGPSAPGRGSRSSGGRQSRTISVCVR
jgi:membrane protein